MDTRPTGVVAEAREHSQRHVYEPDRIAQQAVTYARDHLFERSAVLDRRDIMEAALNRGMGETTYAHVRQEFAQRAARGEFRTVDHAGAGQQYTTAAMLRMERETVQRMQEGNQRGMNDPMLVSPQVRIAMLDSHRELNASQRQAVEQIFLSREKIVGLDGVAGAGKTTTLAVIREGAEAQGYTVEGSRPRPARRKSWPTQVWKHRRCKSILRVEKSRIPESAACMCSMNPRLRPPSRCTSLCIACIPMTACCW